MSSAFPGAAPPTERVSDVKGVKLLSKLSSSSKILYSRNKWCQRAKAFVVLGRMVNRSRPGQCKMAGSQTLDQIWRHVKRYVLYTLALKRPAGSGLQLNPRLLQYGWSFMSVSVLRSSS
ncbi:unnamed protein product [Symbiodinium sp. CCMP2456]|nr:unnamed protein product [Symbiodinium sp. CCMP2456]